jgi:hypothetical protein
VSFRGSEQQADVLAQCLREQGLDVTLNRATDALGDADAEQVDHKIAIEDSDRFRSPIPIQSDHPGMEAA